MKNNLVIVESPAKAKTIEKFLGNDFIVRSSFGHIRDLPKKGFGIDMEKNYLPLYEVSADKKDLVKQLKKIVGEVDMVWLASDEDREGEAIAWHLFEALNLKKDKTKRIVFNEITKTAILKAVENPREIDKNLVDAQQARRVLDRLVGFELSPILWRKIKPSLSAGRVQSVAVRLIVEREREINNFQTGGYFKIVAEFIYKDENGKIYKFKANLTEKIKEKDKAKEILELCRSAKFKVDSFDKKPSKRSPAPPFTTSTLQQEASRKLGYSVAQTMLLAQGLYESGLITYMRTDSINLSTFAISEAKNEIINEFGEKYSKSRNFTTKTKGAQEAHEAIRPTNFAVKSVNIEIKAAKLYDLIWKRAIASQMADAKLEKTIIKISISNSEKIFVAEGEIVVFDGFLKVYLEGRDDESENDELLLPSMKQGDMLDYDSITATERFTSPTARYTEASLVKKLEELGIGRPSTYAPTISTIQKRNYVVKESREGKKRNYDYLVLKNNKIKEENKSENFGAEKNKLFPTDIGMVVNDFLVKYFENVLDYNFTAQIEEKFDDIAEGKVNWTKEIDQFYKPFHQKVVEVADIKEKMRGEKLLGVDEKTGKNIYAKIGRFGPMLQMGEVITKEEEKAGKEKPKFASFSREYSMENITLEEALSLFEVDANNGRYLGDDTTSGKPMYIKVGKFGAYIQLGEKDDDARNVSIPRGQNADSITLEQAIKLVEFPKKIGEYEGSEVAVANGRFGPYISHNKNFYSLSTKDDIYTISIERAIEVIIQKQKQKEERTLKIFAEDDKIKIMLDRFKKPSILYKGKFSKLAPNTDIDKLTYEDCLNLLGINKKKK